MRATWKQALLVLVIFAGLQVVFFAGLVAALAVPDKPILNNLSQAVEAGTYGPSYAPDRMGSMSDTFTECVVAGTGLGAPAQESLLSKAVRMPRLSNCEEGATQILDLAEGRPASSGDYFKYWAGYIVLTRPALATVGLEGLRIISGAVMITSMAVAFLAIRSRIGLPVALAIFAPWLLGTNVLSTPSTSFSQSISIAAIFLSVTLAAHGASRSTLWAIAGAVFGAALFCYVDLLTAPAVPWALTAFTAGAVTWARSQFLRPTLHVTVLTAVAWPVSFALTWVARWAIAGAFLGPGYTWRAIQANVERRTGGAYEGVSDVFGAGVVTNAAYWGMHVPTWWLVLAGCLLAIVVGLRQAVRHYGTKGLQVVAILALPLLVIPLWYIVLSNHSQLHEFFTSRGIPTVLAIATAASLTLAQRASKTLQPEDSTSARPERSVTRFDTC